MRGSRVVGIGAVAYVVALLFTVLWLLFVHPSSTAVIQRTQLLADDGGVYAAMVARVMDDPVIADAPWFRYVKTTLDERDLYYLWGFYSGRMKYVFSDIILTNPYFRWVGFLAGPDGRYEDALYLTMLVAPFLVAVKYAYLAFISPARSRTALLAAMLVADVGYRGHINWWLTAEAYAWHLFSAGLITLLAGRWRPLGWSMMVTGAAIHWSLGAAVLAIAIVMWAPGKLAVARELVGRSARQWSGAYGAIALLAIGTAGIAYAFAAATLRRGFGDPYGLLSVYAAQFAGMFSYVEPGLLATAAAVVWLRRSVPYPGPAGKWLPFATLLVFAFVLSFPLASVVLTPFAGEHTQRLTPYVAAFLTIEGVVLALQRDPRSGGGHADILLAKVLVLAIPLSLGVASFASRLPFSPATQLGASAFPSLRNDIPGCSYFLAATPQQVYGYFIERDYLTAPLVIELRRGAYTLDRATDVACRRSSVPPEAPIAGRSN